MKIKTCLFRFCVVFFTMSLSVAALARTETIDINVGVGPSFHTPHGKISEVAPIIYGLDLDLGAVISKEVVERNIDKIPEKYVSTAKMFGSAKIGYFLIPRTIFYTPKVEGVTAYGATWEPLGLGLTLIDIGFIKFNVGADIVLTYLYLKQEDYANRATHFVRPGIGFYLGLDLLNFRYFNIAVRSQSEFYIPQYYKGTNTLWYRLDSVSLVFNMRFPYQVEY